MTTYAISNRHGYDYGTYEGATAREAIEAMYRDGGYPTLELAADVLGIGVDEMLAEIRADEVA